MAKLVVLGKTAIVSDEHADRLARAGIIYLDEVDEHDPGGHYHLVPDPDCYRGENFHLGDLEKLVLAFARD